MNSNYRTQSFSQDIDNILENKQVQNTGDCPPEYDEILQVASILAETDFSPDFKARDMVRQRLVRACMNNPGNYKEVIMNKLRGRRPALMAGTAAVIALLSFTLVYPGTLVAAAGNMADNISKILHLGKHITVIQVENTSPGNEASGDKKSVTIQAEGVSPVNVASDHNGGLQPESSAGQAVISTDDPGKAAVSYKSLEEAQAAASFKVLVPGYLPAGYTFKEARGYQDSHQYIDLFFSGLGHDIILMQRAMNEETSFGLATDGHVEPVEINGVNGAWVEPHTLMWEKDGVGYSLFCKGFNKEEAIKVANSIK